MQFDKSNDVIRELFKKYRPSVELLEILDCAWMKGFGGSGMNLTGIRAHDFKTDMK